MSVSLLTWWLAPVDAGNDAGSDGTASRRSSNVLARTSDPGVEDAELLVRIRAGDEAAFKTAFDTHAVPLVRIAQLYTHSLATAQDVVQDVFITLWDRRTTLVIRDRLAAYLATATRHRALNAIRTQVRATHREGLAVQYALVQGSATYNSGIAQLETEELTAAFHRAVSALPARQREIFLLHRVHGLDHRTIATMLGIGVPSVHNLMSRAIKRLYEQLKDLI